MKRKSICKVIFLIFALMGSSVTAESQNLDLMTQEQRDSFLIATAKEVVLKYGPDYYREYKEPIISKKAFPLRGDNNPEGINAGRVYYTVTFLYDKTEETLGDYAAEIRIWADTDKPSGVLFGNGFGFSENKDWSQAAAEVIPYQDFTVPDYDLNTYFTNPEPLNKEKLIRKGWVKNSDGNWVKTRPDTPPVEAQRVIKRAQEELKQREMSNK